MRRLGLLIAACTLWLFLAAIPALADGGPHVKMINDGSLGINADSCAGCHRAHTAQGPLLINAVTEEALCLTCHGSGGVGSTVDVMTGVQYKNALALGSAPQDPTDTAVLLGALRNGGFDKARIDAGNGVRITYARNATDSSNRPFVGVGGPEPVTSTHMGMATTAGHDGNDLTMPGIAWGNGAFNPVVDPGLAVADLSCANCHNPHGNGQFRILNKMPHFTDAAGESVATGDLSDNIVPDSGVATNNATKNYTIIQGVLPNYYPYAADIPATYDATDGDYFRRTVPWAVPQDRMVITSVSAGVFTTAVTNGLNSSSVDKDGVAINSVGTIATGDVSITGVTGVPNGNYDVLSATATTFTISLTLGGAPFTGSDATLTGVEFASRIGGGAFSAAGTGTSVATGNPTGARQNFDAPNGQTGTSNSDTGFTRQMAEWCTSCHTRYLADGKTPATNPNGTDSNPYALSSGDAVFTYRHPTRYNRNCTECHVTHGTNAEMVDNLTGPDYSLDVAYPNGEIPRAAGGSANGNSRLLKLDNRGTCQACHEPTETVVGGTLMPTGATLPTFP